MRIKTNRGVIPFSYRKNLQGDAQQQEDLFNLVDYVQDAPKIVVGGLRFYNGKTNATGRQELKTLLGKMYGNKYPFKSIRTYANGALPGYVTYICKEKGDIKASVMRNDLRREVQATLKAQKDAGPTGGPNSNNDFKPESFPLLVGMYGPNCAKLNELLKSKGYLSSNEGDNYTEKTAAAYRSLTNSSTNMIAKSDFDALFAENPETKSDSMFSTTTIIIIVFVVIALFLIIKKRPKNG